MRVVEKNTTGSVFRAKAATELTPDAKLRRSAVGVLGSLEALQKSVLGAMQFLTTPTGTGVSKIILFSFVRNAKAKRAKNLTRRLDTRNRLKKESRYAQKLWPSTGGGVNVAERAE